MEGPSEGVHKAAHRPRFGDVDEGVGVARRLGHRDVLPADAALGIGVEEDAVAGNDGRELFEEPGLADALGADEERVAAEDGAVHELGEGHGRCRGGWGR